MTAISSPNYRWRVGEIEITRVLEFEAALFEPAVIHPEASPEIIARHRTWLEPTLMDPASGLLLLPVAWERIHELWYNYVRGRNPQGSFGIYDTVRHDTVCLDKA